MDSTAYPYQRYLDSGVPAWFVEAVMQEYQRSAESFRFVTKA